MSVPTNHSASKSSLPPKLTSVPSTGALDDKKTKQNCPSCSKPTNACDCQACELCQTPVPLMTAAAAKSKITLSPTELDRNCTRCGIVRCNKCTRKRSNFSGDSSHSCTTEVCTVCAVHTAINFLGTLPLDYNTPGLILLCEVVDRANMCVNPECGRFSYGKECTNCTMPTIQMETPYSGIYVPDVPKGREKVKELENRLSAKRSRIFQEINFKARTLDDALINESVPDLTEDVKLNRRIMLAMICSSVAYEYKSIQIALHFTPFSYANVLLPLECSVARSIFDAPGKVRFVAFPGTHDLKTFHTNIKTSHVRVMLDAADESIKDHEERLKKPGYNVHKGFYRVMQQMKMFDDVLAWIEEGYEVIFCGHSQGGALAQLAAVHLFHHSLEKVRDNISVITMGAPCVGNYGLLEMIKKWNVAHLFHHIIYGHDLIPRILHSFSEMKAKLSSLVETISHVWDNLFEKKKAKGSLTDEAEAIFRKRQLPFVSFGVYHLIQVPKCGIYFFTKDNVHIHVLFSDDGIVPSPVSIHDHLLTNYFKGITHLELEIRHQSKKKREK